MSGCRRLGDVIRVLMAYVTLGKKVKDRRQLLWMDGFRIFGDRLKECYGAWVVSLTCTSGIGMGSRIHLIQTGANRIVADDNRFI